MRYWHQNSRRADKGQPTSAKSAHFNLGFVLEKLGEHEDAASNYEQAIQFDPENASAYFNLSLIYYYELDKWEAALASASEAYRLDPDSAECKEYFDKLSEQADSFWSNIFTP